MTPPSDRKNKTGTEDSSSDEQILPKTMQDELPPTVVADLETYKEQAHGVRREIKEPNEEHISYPEKYSLVDRVLHVLWAEHLREHPVSWIAAAAAADEDTCEGILEVLSTGGIVIQPSEDGADGYRLNPYYKQCIELTTDVDRLPRPTEQTRP